MSTLAERLVDFITAVGGDVNALTNALAGKAQNCNVQIFYTSGTWTKPANAKSVWVGLVGAGGAGGSGRCDAAGTARGGGGGGSGGCYSFATFDAAGLGATETVTVSGAPNGGTGVSTAATNGNAGTSGGASSFGTTVRVQGLGGNSGGGGGSGAAGSAGAGKTGGFGPAAAANQGKRRLNHFYPPALLCSLICWNPLFV